MMLVTMRRNPAGGGIPKAISPSQENGRSRNSEAPHGNIVPSRIITIIITTLLATIVSISAPIKAYADTTTTDTTDAYQLYDTRERTEQVSVNKVWDDGLTNDARKHGNTDYASMLDMTIQTGVPQTTLRTYTITYDANGGSFGTITDTNGNTLGITFGPAIGYPEFSPYNGTDSEDTSSTQTFTKSHTVSGDATVMTESAAACTDTSYSVITGTDAGTDAAGNAYRCLHYDNWNTIIYWNKTDPHVYDKCIPNHCSKTVVITPNAGTIANGIFSTSIWDSERGLTGDGQSYIVNSAWDNQYDGVDITQAGQGYAASLVRAKLVGADSHTKLDDRYAGTDALTKYTSESSILSCFPESLRDAIGVKALSGVSAACSGGNMSYDAVSNDGVADRLWLFSYGEMTDAVYPSAGLRSDSSYDAKRSNKNWWWLRSPVDSYYARDVHDSGYLYNNIVYNYYAVAPGFTLP